jgi:lysophospholipase L1-like esterase
MKLVAKSRGRLFALAPLMLVCGLAMPAQAGPDWVSAWGTNLQRLERPAPVIEGQTFRYRAKVSAAGGKLRVRLSNELGNERLRIGAATVAVKAKSGGWAVRPLTFSGRRQAMAPAGAPLVSDPVDLKLSALQEVTVSLYLPGKVAPAVYDRLPQTGAVVTGPGDLTNQPEAPGSAVPNYFVTSLDVLPRRGLRGLVIFSDTKSAGEGTWPDFFVDTAVRKGVAVSNRSQLAGGLILGLPGDNGQARFDRDVLASAGVTEVLIFTSNNDIIRPGAVGTDGKVTFHPSLALTVDEIIAAYRQVIDRARAKGLRVIGGTLTPYEGANVEGYATPEKLAKRDAINDWIRNGKAFDAVIDFDAVVRDPRNPRRLAPEFDAGNHFTPSEAGYRAMAKAAAKVLTP